MSDRQFSNSVSGLQALGPVHISNLHVFSFSCLQVPSSKTNRYDVHLYRSLHHYYVVTASSLASWSYSNFYTSRSATGTITLQNASMVASRLLYRVVFETGELQTFISQKFPVITTLLFMFTPPSFSTPPAIQH